MNFGMIKNKLYQNNYFNNIGEDGFISDDAKRVWEGDVKQIDESSQDYKDAVKSYQDLRSHKLSVDGDFGPVTLEVAYQEQGYCCKLPDRMFKRADRSEWPESCQREITTSHNLNSLRKAEEFSVDGMWKFAIEKWNEVCNALLTLIDDTTAKIVAILGRMASGTLAWSYLATNNCNDQLDQEYNKAVSWSQHLFWTTVCHEIGHALGFPHGGRGMMQPSHDPNVSSLGEWDINQAVLRYGKPVAVEPPIEPPTASPLITDIHHSITTFYDVNNKELLGMDSLVRNFPEEV